MSGARRNLWDLAIHLAQPQSKREEELKRFACIVKAREQGGGGSNHLIQRRRKGEESGRGKNVKTKKN